VRRLSAARVKFRDVKKEPPLSERRLFFSISLQIKFQQRRNPTNDGTNDPEQAQIRRKKEKTRVKLWRTA
jgi:hypothetical protein